jgi:sugar lactone lactonase YvrE
MQKFTLLSLNLLAAGLAISLVPISARAAARNLYVTNAGTGTTGTIYKFNIDGSSTIFASGLSNPEGLAFDGSGNLFVADNQAGTIFKFTPNGTKSIFASLSSPFSLVVDGNGNLFASQLDLINSNNQSGMIFKFTSTGTKSTFASGLAEPIGLAVDASNNLFVADFAVGKIFKFTPDGTQSTFTQPNFQPSGLAFDGSGNLFVTDNPDGMIFKFTPDGTKSTFASGLTQNPGLPTFLAVDDPGNLFATDSSGKIFIFAPDGTRSTFATLGSPPEFLAFGPASPPLINIRQLLNISTRGRVGTGDEVLIGGFIVSAFGPTNGAVVIRAIGPSLTSAGVAGALQDPTLELHNASGEVIASNDNWKDTQQAQIQASGLAPTDDRESAILRQLDAQAYTAIVRGANDTTGVALVEVYNLQ